MYYLLAPSLALPDINNTWPKRKLSAKCPRNTTDISFCQSSMGEVVKGTEYVSDVKNVHRYCNFNNICFQCKQSQNLNDPHMVSVEIMEFAFGKSPSICYFIINCVALCCSQVVHLSLCTQKKPGEFTPSVESHTQMTR